MSSLKKIKYLKIRNKFNFRSCLFYISATLFLFFFIIATIHLKHKFVPTVFEINKIPPIDYSGGSTSPWENDAYCRKFKTHFALNHSFNPTALVSYPGSGNSWLRYLIEGSTGFFTGSVYNYAGIYSSALLGEARNVDDGSTIVQKTHDLTIAVKSKEFQAVEDQRKNLFRYRGILIIRNPYDAIISYWNLVQTNDQKGHADPETFLTNEWHEFVMQSITKWQTLITTWLKQQSSSTVLIVEYDNLRSNPGEEIKRILSYLHFPVNNERQKCLMKPEHISGPFHRKKPHASYILQSDKSRNTSVYTPLLNSKIQDAIQETNEFFKEKCIKIFLNYKGQST